MEPKKVAECRVSGILFIPIIDCPSGYCCVFNSCTDAMNGSPGVSSATKMFQVCNSSFILIITDHNLQLRLHPSPRVLHHPHHPIQAHPSPCPLQAAHLHHPPLVMITGLRTRVGF